MNNKTLLWGVIAFLAIQAVAIVCLAVFSIGPAGTFLASLASTTGLLVPILIGVQKSFENGVAQQATQMQVQTVQATTQRVAMAQGVLTEKLDTTHDLVNGASHETAAMALEIADLKTRLAAVLAHQAGEKDGVAIGRAQAEGEAALLAQQGAAPIDLTPDVDTDYA